MLNKKGILYILVLLLCIGGSMAINCSELPTEIIIEVDSEPYIHETTNFFATLPAHYFDNEVSCISYIKASNDDIIQVNPRKTEVIEGKITLWAIREESREFFIAQNAIVNAYYTQENLVSYTEFILGVNCVSDDGTEVTGETCITPTYRDLKHVKTRAVWMKDNTDMLFVLFVVIMFIIIPFVFTVFKKVRKGALGR